MQQCRDDQTRLTTTSAPTSSAARWPRCFFWGRRVAGRPERACRRRRPADDPRVWRRGRQRRERQDHSPSRPRVAPAPPERCRERPRNDRGASRSAPLPEQQTFVREGVPDEQHAGRHARRHPFGWDQAAGPDGAEEHDQDQRGLLDRLPADDPGGGRHQRLGRHAARVAAGEPEQRAARVGPGHEDHVRDEREPGREQGPITTRASTHPAMPSAWRVAKRWMLTWRVSSPSGPSRREDCVSGRAGA
jgi:hypothetical protein